MGNLQKITRNLAPSVLDEIERTPETAKKFNPETHYIRPELTQFNYDLTQRNMSALDYLNKRLSEVKVQNRSDVKVLGQWVWTMPKDLDPVYQDEFFREIYNYNVEKFGEENICYATVHVDELTPHMHLGIIPIVKVDKVRKDGKTKKVCAKDVFNRDYLQHAHADLEQYLETKLGVEVNILNGESLGVDGIRNFKAAKDLAKQIPILQEQVKALNAEIYEKQDVSRELDKVIETKKGIVSDLDNQITVQRSILGKLKDKVKEVKEVIKDATEKLIGHPNMFQMFFHWLNKGEELDYEREEVVEDYHNYLDKYDLTLQDTDNGIEEVEKEIKRYKRSQDRGLSL